MEILRSWGLEDEVRSGGVDVEWVHWFCDTLASADTGHGYPTGYPTKLQSSAISPTSPACVPQDHLEPVLLNHLRSLETAQVELGTEVTGVETLDDRVRVSLRDVDGGASRVIDARYVIAADGAHSAVRRALGIDMRGPDRLVEAITTLFRAPLWDVVAEHRYGIYMIMHPQAEGVIRPTGHGDRWDYILMYEPGSRAADLADDGTVQRFLYRRAWFGGLRVADLTPGGMAKRIQAGSGVPGLEPRIERIAGFSFAAQVAECFRVGNAFLVGDAAHRATPRGGTGMNTALHDGYDLGWKVAWVLRGWAGPHLLDSYERERRPVVEHNVELSADSRRTFHEPGQELPVDLGGRIGHAWTSGTAAVGNRVSTLDLLGPGLTLFTGPDRAPWDATAAAARAPLPVAVRTLDTITARAIGIQAGGALISRPDGVMAGYLPAATDAAAHAVRSAISDPIPGAAATPAIAKAA